MGTPLERFFGSWSLPRRLAAGLAAAALILAGIAGTLAASRSARTAEAEAAARAQRAAQGLAARAAPLLQRRDLMRLSVLAAAVGDRTGDRVLLLDREGEVLIDTSLALGGSTLPLLAADGATQRTVDDGEGPASRETAAPARAAGASVGEVRLRRALAAAPRSFDAAWFGLVLVGGLALAGLAALLAAGWSRRARRATDALVRVAAGGASDVDPDGEAAELLGFGRALRDLEEGTAGGQQQVRDAFVAMALDVVEGLEQRQLVAAGHGRRTAALAADLADRLQLAPADSEDLDVACRLAELGKASLRSALLQQQEPLGDQDWESLEHHPVHAAERLALVPALSGVASIVRHQLERYDGRGAPDGLRGDRIPLGARVLAIAAAFDTMTTACADAAIGWRDALEKLERAKGEVFDPGLVDLFCELVRQQPPESAGREAPAPGHAAPWRELALAGDEGALDEPEGEELELMIEDASHEGLRS